MRVEDGYRPKVKFSVSFYPDTYQRLAEICKNKGIHKSNFIENAVLAALDDRGRVRPQAQPLMRSTKDFKASIPKKQDVRMLSRKPRRKDPR
jgi:hypothetical protein